MHDSFLFSFVPYSNLIFFAPLTNVSLAFSPNYLGRFFMNLNILKEGKVEKAG